MSITLTCFDSNPDTIEWQVAYYPLPYSKRITRADHTPTIDTFDTETSAQFHAEALWRGGRASEVFLNKFEDGTVAESWTLDKGGNWD
mgnify:CR=1 FL=1